VLPPLACWHKPTWTKTLDLLTAHGKGQCRKHYLLIQPYWWYPLANSPRKHVQTKSNLWSRLSERPRTCHSDPGHSTHLHSKPADPSHCKSPSKKAAKQATLICHVSASEQLKFTHALSDPSHGIIQKIEETLLALTPAHTQALGFFNEMQNKSARNTARLQHLSEEPAEEQVHILAIFILVTNLIESIYNVALKTCSSTSKRTTGDQQQKELTQTVRSFTPPKSPL
jgi:hypothetical protein